MLPTSYKRVIATRISPDFRNCTKVETVTVPKDFSSVFPKPTQLLVKQRYVGINASDINYTNGKYRPNLQPPFACGMEAIGEVVAMSESADARQKAAFPLGTPVITSEFGAFSEYQLVPARFLRKVPRVDPKLLALEISGTTASIALEQVAQPVAGETALVTAAAGGTGLFACSLLKKKYGCRVIATCSNDVKADFLKNKVGCDLVVNYTKEDVGEFVSKNCGGGGLNVVYESIGGSMLEMALEHVAVRGRIVTIGGITAYSSGGDWAATTSNASKIPQLLLGKSASLRGFFLPHFKKLHESHFNSLLESVDKGELESYVDETVKFEGIESIGKAVEHLHSKKNIGKVIVKL